MQKQKPQLLPLLSDATSCRYCQKDDSPERMADTLAFWKILEAGVFDVYLSQVTFDEVNACYEPKRSYLLSNLGNIDYTNIDITENMLNFAQKVIDSGILSQSSFDDCQHIAAAVALECDCIVSWNFKHLVNIKTIRGVRELTSSDGKKVLDIVTPSSFLDKEETT